MNELTQAYVRELFDYDAVSGYLIWKKKIADKVIVGRRAGGDGGDKRILGIHGKMYLEHRIIWLWVHGYLPINLIDHINGNPLDNRLCNLREATVKQNSENLSKMKKPCSSKYLGVHYCNTIQKWIAKIKHNGKTTTIGRFTTEDEAYKARLKKQKELFTHHRENV